MSAIMADRYVPPSISWGAHHRRAEGRIAEQIITTARMQTRGQFDVLALGLITCLEWLLSDEGWDEERFSQWVKRL
jgi:hypothetical protein